MTPAERIEKGSRLSALRRVYHVERRLKDYDDSSPTDDPEARLEDVEHRLATVEGRVDVLVEAAKK